MTSSRCSQGGGYGGSDYGNRYNYSDDKGGYGDRGRGYRDDRPSFAGFLDRSREDYMHRKSDDMGMPLPSGIPTSHVSSRGSFRGRIRGSRGISRILARRASSFLTRKRGAMGCLVRKQILISRTRAENLTRLKLQKLRRIKELAKKKVKITKDSTKAEDLVDNDDEDKPDNWDESEEEVTIKQDSDFRAVCEEDRPRLPGSLFICLYCPVCHMRFSFKDYSTHLFTTRHENTTTLHHKQTLACMHMKQRKEQHIIEDSEEVLSAHSNFCHICKLNYCQMNTEHQTSESHAERLGRFVPHLVQLLAEWTETFPYDFRDEAGHGARRNLMQKCVTIEPGIRKEVSTLLQNLLHRLTALEKYEEFLHRINAESTTASFDSLSTMDVTELSPSPALLAQQLTHIELERLSYIGPEEIVQAFAKENPHLETSFKDMKKTRNLESYVQWFNRLSYFVATEVCKHVKKKQRVKVMEYWIEAARECFNIGNFNSLMAIIAGLNMSPVSRLKKTWSKVQSAKFSILEHQMDPSSNFSSYRSTLKAAMWRSAGATDERQRIVIPFFSLLVKDLYFLNEGCSSKLPNGHINFEKFWQLAKQVTEFITWKQVACPFEKNTKVITFLQGSPVLTENALALASFECEPPENNVEKERYKSLKSELTS